MKEVGRGTYRDIGGAEKKISKGDMADTES